MNVQYQICLLYVLMLGIEFMKPVPDTQANTGPDRHVMISELSTRYKERDVRSCLKFIVYHNIRIGV